jgi:hypothetical protein
MTHQEIADQLKDIVVKQCAKQPEDRDWFVAIDELIDELEKQEG